MKLCIVTPIFPPQIGGPATYVSELSERLHKDGHEVKVITLGKELPKELEYKVHLVRRQNLLLREISLFKRIIEHARDCDLIYAQGIAAIGMPSILAGKLLKKKVVVKYVGDSAWEKALREGKSRKSLEEFLERPDAFKWMVRIQRQVLHEAGLIVTPSNYLKAIIHRYYGVREEKIKVIYNSVDLGLGKKKKTGIKGKVILTIGRLVPWKNVDLVIKAFEMARKYEKNAKLVVIGDGPLLKELQELAKALKIEKEVIFLGRKAHEEVVNYMRSADVFVLYSGYEGMSHVLLEAMASKVPIVASDISPNRELLEKECGILVKNNDAEELCRNIVNILRNRRKAGKLVLNAFKKVKKEHDGEEKYKEIRNLLKSMVE